MERQLDYVLRTVEERGVRFVRLWFTDVLGLLKSFAITPAELEVALEEGMAFDGSAIEGYTRVQESDMLAVPDPNTFEIVPVARRRRPSRPGCSATSTRLDGEPFDGDPRYVLKRNLERAREKGFTFYAGPGDGVLLLPLGEPIARAARHRHATSTSPTADMVSELRKQTILTLEAMGIPVEYSFHELGPSQHEIDLRYTDALDDGRQRDDVPARREGGRAGARRATPRSCRSRSPARTARGCTPTSRCSRATSTRSTTPATSTGCRRSAKRFIAGLLATPARSPPSPTSGSTPTSGSIDRGYEAPTLRVLGPQQPLRARAGADRRSGARRARPASSTARPTRPATPTSRSA